MDTIKIRKNRYNLDEIKKYSPHTDISGKFCIQFSYRSTLNKESITFSSEEERDRILYLIDGYTGVSAFWA